MNRLQIAICTAVADSGFTLKAAAKALRLDEDYLLDYVTRVNPGELPPTVRDGLSRITAVPVFVFSGADKERHPASYVRDGKVLYPKFRHRLDQETNTVPTDTESQGSN